MLNLLFAMYLNASATTIKGVDVAEQTKLGEQTLVLNGAGVRSKYLFSVYVGALYVPAKSKDADKLMSGPAVIELTFLRDLDKATLQKAWTEGVEKNCKVDCERAKALLVSFNDLMVDVKDKDRMRLEFTPTAVTVTFSGSSSKTGKIEGDAFRTAMFRVFVGLHPPTDEVKKALLGG